jgi:hypothetical protein
MRSQVRILQGALPRQTGSRASGRCSIFEVMPMTASALVARFWLRVR